MGEREAFPGTGRTADEDRQLMAVPDVAHADGSRRQMAVQHHRVDLDALRRQVLQTKQTQQRQCSPLRLTAISWTGIQNEDNTRRMSDAEDRGAYAHLSGALSWAHAAADEVPEPRRDELGGGDEVAGVDDSRLHRSQRTRVEYLQTAAVPDTWRTQHEGTSSKRDRKRRAPAERSWIGATRIT